MSHALPARRVDAQGVAHVDLRAVGALVLPLFFNSGIQVVLNLTDTWFVGRLSINAMAAMGACYYLSLLFFIGVGGIGMAVQTLAAQYFGAGRYADAARAAWGGLWAALITVPLFWWLAESGGTLLHGFGLDPEIERLAQEYWLPRLWGGPFSVALWSLSSFFNGCGYPKITLKIMAVVALANALLNPWFIFTLGLGLSGAAIATTLSLVLGMVLAIIEFRGKRFRLAFHSHEVWRPDGAMILKLFKIGIPTGLFPAMDIVGLSLFQLMQTRYGAVDGAATQIVMMLSSVAYLPAIGIALAGTTLVGQSIGAGDREWANRCAHVIQWMAVIYMGTLGLLLALSGPWVVPLFISGQEADALRVASLSARVLWIVALFQVMDALNLSSAFCLRGAGDVRVPTVFLMVLSVSVFIPLCHSLTFASGQGWVHFLPQFNLGAVGGWSSALVYTTALGLGLWARWQSGAWRRIDLLH
jgi:MATE family multidrug resistance protein